MSDLHIIPYSPLHQPHFYRLNAAWISSYFVLEEEDKAFLTDPERYIIAPGGMVWFAMIGDEVVGTCGIMRMDNHTYELVRMTVDQQHRSKKIGEALLRHSVAWAKVRGARQVILETSSSLIGAIALYTKFGFSHYTPAPQHRSGLARADVFMRLSL